MEGTESWLNDMATSGYFLEKDGFWSWIAVFLRKPPRAVRYKLIPAQKNTSMWSDDGGLPADELLASMKEYSWEYVDKRGNFYIFSNENEEVKEYNTDDKTQALNLNYVRKKERSNLVLKLLIWVAYPLFYLRGNILMFGIEIGSFNLLWGMLLVLWMICEAIKKITDLRKLQKNLREGKLPDHNKNWRKGALWYRTRRVLFPVLVISWVICLMNWCFKKIDPHDTITLDAYAKEIPFPTMEDLSPGAEFVEKDYTSYFGFSNTIEVKSDWLAPTVIYLRQSGSFQRENNLDLSGSIEVKYYETKSSWIAKELARESHRNDKLRNKKLYKTIELSNMEADYAVAYSVMSPKLILVKDNLMIKITFYQTSKNHMMPDTEWMRIYAVQFLK